MKIYHISKKINKSSSQIYHMSAEISKNSALWKVYHRTHVDNLNGILNEGFHHGEGQAYGPGLYATFDLDSQLRDEMKPYGDMIVSFIVNGGNFLDLTKGKESIVKQIKSNERIPHKKGESDSLFVKRSPDGTSLCGKNNLINYINQKYDDGHYTSDIAQIIYPCAMKYFDGIVFYGRQDGFVVVVYNYEKAKPFEVLDNEGRSKVNVVKDLEKIRYTIEKSTIINKIKNNPYIDIPDKFANDSEIFELRKNAFLSLLRNDMYTNIPKDLLKDKNIRELATKLWVDYLWEHPYNYCNENYTEQIPDDNLFAFPEFFDVTIFVLEENPTYYRAVPESFKKDPRFFSITKQVVSDAPQMLKFVPEELKNQFDEKIIFAEHLNEILESMKNHGKNWKGANWLFFMRKVPNYLLNDPTIRDIVIDGLLFELKKGCLWPGVIPKDLLSDSRIQEFIANKP